MNEKEKKIMASLAIFLIFSLITGGASAILVVGIVYDVLYALHKITSVMAAVFFILLYRVRARD
ncbi:MAG: hypothetical protein GF311_25495 [Candidatus Lokiarchaeota archaeon]|nr:hypothetical protein [Candidatus Lokiarchaeota archaeon]